MLFAKLIFPINFGQMLLSIIEMQNSLNIIIFIKYFTLSRLFYKINKIIRHKCLCFFIVAILTINYAFSNGLSIRQSVLYARQSMKVEIKMKTPNTSWTKWVINWLLSQTVETTKMKTLFISIKIVITITSAITKNNTKWYNYKKWM